ncbi:hypothetical protein JCM16303_000594 [Sporobolomyces ruberrimus]
MTSPSLDSSGPDSRQSTRPLITPSAPYTSFYCEENVYLLVKALSTHQEVRAVWACFVSNLNRTAILFNQKASRRGEEQGSYVIWDYHVFAVAALRTEEGERTVSIDRDSNLGPVVELENYIEQTFHPLLFREQILDPELESRVRIVPGDDFLRNFASDRSHMLVANNLSRQHEATATLTTPLYVHPPPSYPPIRGLGAVAMGEGHNLWTKFLDMRLEHEKEESTRESGFGSVLASVESLLEYNFRN